MTGAGRGIGAATARKLSDAGVKVIVNDLDADVQGVMGAGTHNKAQVFDEKLIAKRSEVIGYGIDVRRQRFPEEEPYQYQPFVEQGLAFAWDENAKTSLKDYNALDLSI